MLKFQIGKRLIWSVCPDYIEVGVVVLDRERIKEAHIVLEFLNIID